MTEEKKSFFTSTVAIITPVLAIATAIYSFFFTIRKDKLDEQTAALNKLQTQVDNQLRQKEFENDLKLKIYDEVKLAITEKQNSQLQNATFFIVNEMLKEDSSFRENLKSLLFSSPNTTELIGVQEKINLFDSTQKNVDATIAINKVFKPNSSYTIDVFFLEEFVKAKSLALKAVDLIKTDFPGYKVYPRRLPTGINARKGYRISGNQIRCEPAEEKLANRIKELLTSKRVFSKEQPKVNIINNKTPNYISVFVRGN